MGVQQQQQQQQHLHLLRKIESFIEEHPSKTQLYPHRHPLTLRSGNGGEIECGECEKVIRKGTPTYVCRKCKYFIHKSCKLDLPLKIYPWFHAKHHLTLHFHQQEQEEDEDELAKFRTSSKRALACSACELPFLGPTPPPTYACTKCDFYIHKFCAELPSEIQHPLHPRHPLRLSKMTSNRGHSSQRSERKRDFDCDICERTSWGFAFLCMHCDFKVDLHCMFLNPTINNQQAHRHPLTLLQEQSTDSLEGCLDCGKSFSGPPVLRCVRCRINFHIQCRLPSNIKSKCHVDPLALVDSLEEDSLSDDEYYCDACEEERIPKQSVYQCVKGCSYVAHVNCAYAKIENVIKHGRIKHEGYKWSEKLVILEDLFKSLTLEDNEVVKDIISAVPVERIPLDSILPKQKIDTNKAFEMFMKRFDSIPDHSPDLKLYHSSLISKVVKIGNYVIPKNLAPVLEALLAKYGDFSAESTTSLEVQNCIYIALCDVVYHMCNTRLEDLDEHEVFNWRDWFFYAQNAGFRVQFAVDYLKKIVQAYFGLQAKSTSLAVEELDHEIKKLHAKIEDLEAKKAQHLAAPVMSLEEEFWHEAYALDGQKVGENLLQI